MRKFLVRALMTSLACVVTFLLINFSLSFTGMSNWLPNAQNTTGGYGHMLLRLREAENVKDVDILFIGSSHIYRGFDPRIFSANGIETFNLGSSAQTPFNSYFLLKEHLQHIKPKNIVLDMSWGVLENDGLEATIDIQSNHELTENIVNMSLATRSKTAYSSLMNTYFARLGTPLDDMIQIESSTDRYIKGGFSKTDKVKNSLSINQLKNLKPVSFAPNSKQLEYLNKIIKLGKEQNIKLIFVVTPVTEEYKVRLVNYAEYHDLIQNIAEEGGGVLLDYNTREDLELSSHDDFYDAHHLTYSGVIIFNNHFIKDLHQFKLLLNKISEN